MSENFIIHLTREVKSYKTTTYKSMQICNAMNMLAYAEWGCSCCQYNDGLDPNGDCICDFYNLMR